MMAKASRLWCAGRFSIVILVCAGVGVVVLRWLYFEIESFSGSRYAHYANGGSYIGADPSSSPDGRSIVFSSPVSGSGDIYVYERGSNRSRQLTRNPVYEASPRFSPDGQSIVYLRGDHRVTQLWIMRSDGSHQHRLTSGNDYAPTFTANSASVVFSREYDDGNTALFRVPISGGTPVRISSLRETANEASFDKRGDRMLYFSSGPPSGLWMLKNNSHRHFVCAGGLSPDISPDGNQVVFIENTQPRHIVIVNQDGTGRHNIFESAAYLSATTFTPDGKHVLYLNEGEAGRGIGEVIQVDIDGSRPIRVCTIQ